MTFKHAATSAIAALGLALTASNALSQDAASEDAALQALEDALPGTLLHNPLNNAWEPGGRDIKTKLVDAEALMTGRAMSVKIKNRQDKPWDTYMRAEIDGEVKKGDTVQVIYYARTAKPARGMDTGDVSLFLGRNEDPYDYIIAEEFKPSTEWELKSMTGTANADFPAGTVKLEYQLGRAAQTVEFGPVYVSRLD